MDFHEKVYGVDDELLKEKVRSIPRDDVAEVCLQSLVHEDAVNRSFDIISILRKAVFGSTLYVVTTFSAHY